MVTQQCGCVREAYTRSIPRSKIASLSNKSSDAPGVRILVDAVGTACLLFWLGDVGTIPIGEQARRQLIGRTLTRDHVGVERPGRAAEAPEGSRPGASPAAPLRSSHRPAQAPCGRAKLARPTVRPPDRQAPRAAGLRPRQTKPAAQAHGALPRSCRIVSPALAGCELNRAYLEPKFIEEN